MQRVMVNVVRGSVELNAGIQADLVVTSYFACFNPEDSVL